MYCNYFWEFWLQVTGGGSLLIRSCMTCDSNKNIKTFSCRLWFATKLVEKWISHISWRCCVYSTVTAFSATTYLLSSQRLKQKWSVRNGSLAKPTEIMIFEAKVWASIEVKRSNEIEIHKTKKDSKFNFISIFDCPADIYPRKKSLFNS